MENKKELNNASEALKEGFAFFNLPIKEEHIDEQVQTNLQKSVIEKRVIKITYKENDGKIKCEKMFPHGFVCQDGSLYLVSARHQGQTRNSNILVKYIKMANILKVDFDGSETFVLEDNISIQELTEHSFGISNEKPVVFKLHFNENVVKTARTYIFQKDQIVIENQDGSCDIQFKGVSVLDLSWFLCRFGKSVQVLEPANFKELAEQAQQEFENNGCQRVATSWIKEIV